MYEIEIKKKVFKFIETLNNFDEIKVKLKELKEFKSDKKLHLDIERLKGQDKNTELYRLRIGEVRFIFEVLKDENTIIIKLADYRGRIYN